MFQFIAAHVDDAQMTFKVTDRQQQCFHDNVLHGMNVVRDLAGKQRHILVDDNNDSACENENAHGFDAEQKIVVSGIVFGIFQNERGMIVFKFNTWSFVGVYGGGDGMFVHLIVIDQFAAFGFIRHDINFDLNGTFIALNNSAVHHRIFLKHGAILP